MAQTARLIRRKGVYHYRRRVPDALVAVIGKREVHQSLGTTSLAEAKKRRALWDLRWDARFEDAAAGCAAADHTTAATPTPSEPDVLELVQAYVAHLDQNARRDALLDPPESDLERDTVRENLETGISILKSRDDPRAAEWITAVVSKLQQAPVTATTGVSDPEILLAEMVRRGLIEIERRKLAQLDQLPAAPFFDTAFDPDRPPEVTFGEMCRQFTDMVEEDAEINGTSQKWVDKQSANVALLKEIIGEATFLRQVDYDACLRVRSALARLPANRTKIYGDLTIEEAIAAARSYLFEAANIMLTRSRASNPLKTWGTKLAKRAGFKKTRVALARRMAVVLHRMWADGTDFGHQRVAA